MTSMRYFDECLDSLSVEPSFRTTLRALLLAASS